MPVRYELAKRLLEADPAALGQRVPRPLHERVEELCDLVYEAGNERPTKAKMIGALILAAPPTVPELHKMLTRFEAATVRDAVVERKRIKAKHVTYPDRSSGPRRTS
jgi:hypothetical protein